MAEIYLLFVLYPHLSSCALRQPKLLLLLQIPQNIFNMADHAISNNTLEKWLLILQILQLGYGLVNNELQLPGMVSSLVYFFIIGAAVALVMLLLRRRC